MPAQFSWRGLKRRGGRVERSKLFIFLRNFLDKNREILHFLFLEGWPLRLGREFAANWPLEAEPKNMSELYFCGQSRRDGQHREGANRP
jgi:hypothetical protein